eukprot:7239289-Pyramimonas_sp.AAC.1
MSRLHASVTLGTVGAFSLRKGKTLNSMHCCASHARGPLRRPSSPGAPTPRGLAPPRPRQS